MTPHSPDDTPPEDLAAAAIKAIRAYRGTKEQAEALHAAVDARLAELDAQATASKETK